jgi:hypothetical protein
MTTRPPVRPDRTITFSTDTAGEWRWNLRAANHEIVADSAEGYRDLDDARVGAAITTGLPAVAMVDGARLHRHDPDGPHVFAVRVVPPVVVKADTEDDLTWPEGTTGVTVATFYEDGTATVRRREFDAECADECWDDGNGCVCGGAA